MIGTRGNPTGRTNRTSSIISIFSFVLALLTSTACSTTGAFAIRCNALATSELPLADVQVRDLVRGGVDNGIAVRITGVVEVWIDRLVLFDDMTAYESKDYKRAVELEIPKCITDDDYNRLELLGGSQVEAIGQFYRGGNLGSDSLRNVVLVRVKD